jgi:hypothetical protein
MMMLPPVVVSLPFKLIFFVLVDGWSLVAGSQIHSYGTKRRRAAHPAPGPQTTFAGNATVSYGERAGGV